MAVQLYGSETVQLSFCDGPGVSRNCLQTPKILAFRNLYHPQLDSR